MKSASSRIQSPVNKDSNEIESYSSNVENSEKIRSKSEIDPGKSLAYYLDFYNKKHMVLKLENNQDQLNHNLKQRKLNNHLLVDKFQSANCRKMNKHFKMGDRSFTLLSEKSTSEFATSSQNSIISNYKTEIENLKYTLPGNQQDLVKDFIKFSKSNNEQISMAKKHILK